jgi:hypothetical protein
MIAIDFSNEQTEKNLNQAMHHKIGVYIQTKANSFDELLSHSFIIVARQEKFSSSFFLYSFKTKRLNIAFKS